MGVWTGLSPAASVSLGIIVGLLSTCVQSLGLTMQRKSHMLEDLLEDEPRRPAYRRRRWQIGMLLFLVANIVGSSIQITTLPLPLLSTLQASGLVFNSLLASLLLKEPWTLRTGYGTVLVAAGAVLISLFSALPEPSHNLAQLLDLLRVRAFLVWFVLSLVFVLGVLAMDFTLRRLIPPRRRESPRLHLVRGMSYGAVSGILSAHALLLAKSAVELIVRSVADKRNQFDNYRAWLLVLAFLVLALSQLYYLHLGLRLISTSILYPFVFCIYNIVAILDGLIYFRQMDRLPPLHAGLIGLGTVVLLAGVLALSWRLQDEDGEDDQHPLLKPEIPQTVLAPGMGFVGDPDSDEAESAIADDEATRDVDVHDEDTPLIDSGTKRARRRSASTAKTGHSFHGRRRKRAATLKEMLDIWDERGDDIEDGGNEAYGTFATDTPAHERPRSAGEQEQQMPSRLSGPGLGLESSADGPTEAEDDTADVEYGGIRRARTMPNPQHRSRSRRRKSGHGQGSGALFSELLKMDWWRNRRKEDENDEHDQREE